MGCGAFGHWLWLVEPFRRALNIRSGFLLVVTKLLIMKSIFLAGILSIFFASCMNKEVDVKSTKFDSTNVKGEAPVRYEGADPTDSTPNLPNTYDTGKRANTKAEFEQ